MNLKPIFEVISVLKEYLIPHKKIKSKFQNLENLDDIKIFIQERSALVSQTTLYGYLKTRMGLKYTLMFTDKIFLESELTQTLCIFFDFKQDLIDQYMSGRPLILIIFLFLIPFEPPLAKIIAIVCSFFFLNKVFTNI